MNGQLARLGKVAAVGLAGAWLAARVRQPAWYYYRLFQAKRVADEFYRTCATVSKNVAYMGAGGPALDVYRPDTGAGWPVLVYVYGGSWNSGQKELYAPVAQRLLPEGLVVVVPDYTTYPAAGFPRQTEQIAAALAWVLDHIAEYGGDPRRVVVAAQSAGAQIAGLALLDPQWLAAHGHNPAEICGFVGVSGVFDMDAVADHVRAGGRPAKFLHDVVGGKHNLGKASPITYAGPNAPRTLLIHGDADPTVPVSVSAEFHRRLLAAGAQSELLVYPRAGHSALLFKALSEKPSRLVGDLLRFTRECTASPNGNG